ncbi:MAG: hypothetical protein MR912_04095, partial [Prevotella sp.]|nr:hypothetical protein [Prevotella sp.]
MQIDRTVYLTIIPTAQNQKTKTNKPLCRARYRPIPSNRQPKTNNQKPTTPIINAMDYFYSSAFTECIH